MLSPSVTAVFLQLLALGCFVAAHHDINNPRFQKLPSLREQSKIQDAWTKGRIEKVPQVLQKYGVGAWLMSQKEYAEDTVFWSLKKATQFSARRRTIDLFLANSTAGSPSAYSWIDNTPNVWVDVIEVLEKHNPESIAINIDTDVAFSSGLHAGELQNFLEKLPSQWKKKLVTVPMVAVEVVGTMPESRIGWYRKLQETAWAMISEGFSAKVITPGITSTADVEWHLRELIQYHNYTTWFQPDVNILGSNEIFSSVHHKRDIITYGDILHIDFGVTAMGLNTDTQHLAYVLSPGETEDDIPQGLKEGLKKANRLQDIVKGNMKVGSSGNDILRKSLDQMKKEGFGGKVYSHPIGDWGHSAGTLVGMFNLQDKVDVLGDLPLLNETYYSVELYAEHFVPERNYSINFYQEEDIYWVDSKSGWDWVFGRQEKFHLIHPLITERGLQQEL